MLAPAPITVFENPKYTITVRYTGCDSHLARVKGQNCSSSCTCSAEAAVKAVAHKFSTRLGGKPWLVTRNPDGTYTMEILNNI